MGRGDEEGRKGEAYEVVCLPDFVGGFLQSTLGNVDPSVAIVNVLLHVAHVVVFEAEFSLVGAVVVFGF